MTFSGGERGKYPTWLAWDQSEENSLIRILLYWAETERYLISLVPSLTNSVTKLVIMLWCPSSAGGMSWCEVGSKLFCRVEFLLWSCCPAHCRSLLDHLGTQTLFSYWLCFLFALHTDLSPSAASCLWLEGIYWYSSVAWPCSWVGSWVMMTENFLEELRLFIRYATVGALHSVQIGCSIVACSWAKISRFA